MLINKITTGFVIQTFDTEKKQYTHQEFIASDQVDYEVGGPEHDGEGIPMSHLEMESFGFGPNANPEPYLPFDMLQPAEIPFVGQKLGENK